MNSHIGDLLAHIGRLEREVEAEFDCLNAIEKLNCVCCGYAIGALAYVREIAGRTQQYWRPIRHARRVRAPHEHYRHFVDYGDAEGYHRQLMPSRPELESRRSDGHR